ncbi:MAG: hypothetical protein E4H21_10605 [Thermodesulfobacteriales bacterium]|nr:MAG: hypothetical protein E4H21_10605 [Thermodesulfobacteriales bacterium]
MNEEERIGFIASLPNIVRDEIPDGIPIDRDKILNRYVMREDERRRIKWDIESTEHVDME